MGYEMGIKIMIALLILLFFSCAGLDYTGNGIRQRDICTRVPVGIEGFQYMDPSLKDLKISCRDVARCAALTGGAPANVPCE